MTQVLIDLKTCSFTLCFDFFLNCRDVNTVEKSKHVFWSAVKDNEEKECNIAIM